MIALSDRVARCCVVAALCLASCSNAFCASPVPDATTPDGGRYYGRLVKGKLHGHGRLEWRNGASFVGEFRDGLAEGKGRYTDPRGSIYEGHYHLGVFSGEGSLHDISGATYVGTFVNNMFNGKGRYSDGEGNLYEGDFVDGKFTGQGVLSTPGGPRHEGQFVNWRPQGSGKFTSSEGTSYEGWFERGNLIGSARIEGEDGSLYEGEVSNWMPNGQGSMHLPNGDVYVGHFTYGMFDGEGTLTYAKAQSDGRLQDTGIWRAGRLKKQQDEETQRMRSNLEAALYAQPALLDDALAKLQPRTPDKINLYLLSVAGDGTQEVFRRETEFVQRSFAERFATAGHSVALINAKNSADQLPIATVTSVRRALAAIGARMDKTQDILFVYLSSHGSKEHELSLDLPGAPLPGLSAAALHEALEASGVRWKVLVVSACYSGGFIDALRDAHTLVITSARADRTSFGCADENDFTYFGRAFFKEALPQSSSFEEAFEKATVLIAQWETTQQPSRRAAADDDAPDTKGRSLPQIASTPEIEAHLKRWWAQMPPPTGKPQL